MYNPYITEWCDDFNYCFVELGIMASNLKEKFDSLMDKSFPPTANNKSQRSRPAPDSARDNNDDTSQESAADTADEDQRINYAEVCTLYIQVVHISLTTCPSSQPT